MQPDREAVLASAMVIGIGILWGLYWVPVRALVETGLQGGWGTTFITLAAVLALAPFLIGRFGELGRAGATTLVAIALGGAAFALYSVGFTYGRVAIIVLLYFLTPVWSTIIARVFLGWRTTPLRLAAIGVGLLGLGIMLGADGQAPLPQGLGEWLALLAGLLWSISSTGIRTRSALGPLPSAFVFAIGAFLTSLGLTLWLAPMPTAEALSHWLSILAISVGTGVLWWGLSIAGLIWAALRLDPARVGILLMIEVLIGAGSAAIWAGEQLSPLEILGGALVIGAGVLEVWPARRKPLQSEPLRDPD